MNNSTSTSRELLRFCIPLLLIMLSAVILCGCAGTNEQAETETIGTQVIDNLGITDSSEITDNPQIIESPVIIESKHQRETDYMAVFDTHMISAESFTLHMENRIYEEAALREASDKLRSDLSALENAIGVKPESVTVYLVESTPNGCPQTAGSQVFCSLEDFENGTCREAIAGVAYSLPCVWQRVGLTEYVFGEENTVDLKEYYADGAHALAASCSAIHLSPDLSDAETVSAARQTSKSLTAFVLDKDGFSAFREITDPGTLLPEWSNSLDISPAPSLPEGSAEMGDLTLVMTNGNDCVLKVKNFSVTISENSWLIDPDGLYNWFCDFFCGMDMVLEQIAAEAPSALAVAEKRYAEPISIIFSDIDSYTYSYPTQNKIVLTKYNAIWHEMVHLLLEETVVIKEQEWIEEALAEYFSYAAQTRFAPTRYYSDGFEAYLQFFEEVSGKEAETDDLMFHNQVWELYQAFKKETDSDDNEAYCRAYGIVSLLSQDQLKRTQVRMLYDKSIAFKRGQAEGSKNNSGTALTYPEAVALFEYLCEQYGMDDVINVFLKGDNLAKTFGINYSEYYTAAIDYYGQQYSALLLAN